MSGLPKILGLPDFRRLLAGVTTSQLGDQYHQGCKHQSYHVGQQKDDPCGKPVGYRAAKQHENRARDPLKRQYQTQGQRVAGQLQDQPGGQRPF